MSFSEYIGRFHAALVHIPIGIFLAVVVLEFLALKEKYKTLLPAVGILLRLGFVAACFAAGTGYLHKQAEDFDPVLVTTHLSFAITVIVVSLISIILYDKRSSLQRVYYSSLIGLTILVIAAGHTGANLTYGIDYLFPSNLGKQEKPLANLSPDAHLYSDLIKPVLDKKCVGCHGPSRQKGKLRLDAPDFITKGGEDGAILNKDLPEESDFWNRLTLDLNHDDHMPPSEKPQLTKAELSLILYWLSRGTDFESTLGSLPNSDSIISRVADLSGETEDAAERSVAMPDENLLSELRDGGVTVSFLSKDDGRVSLQFINADDSKLPGLMDKLAGLKAQLPLTGRLLEALLRLAERIERARGVPLIAARVDLHLVAVVHAIPGVRGRLRHADHNARVAVRARRLEDNANSAIAQRTALVIEQPHAADGLHLTILDGKAPPAGHLPTAEVAPVEQLLALGRRGGQAHHRQKRGSRQPPGAAHGLVGPLLGVGDGLGLFVLLGEPLHTAFGVDQLLLPGEERVAVGADFHADIALVRGARLELVPARADDVDFFVGGVNSGFHGNG